MHLLTRYVRFYLLYTLVSIEVKCDPSIMEAIEAAAASLPPDSISMDKILIQWLHRANSITTYHDADKGQNSPALFTRQTIDTNKEIVVLSSDEDNLPVTIFKRTFVVLKLHTSGETGDATNADYKIFYAYVRDAKEDDPLAVAVGNQKIRIEFDNWDGRGSSTNPARSLGWTTCFESIHPTCKAEFSDAVKNDKRPKESGDDVDYSSDQDNNVDSSNPVSRNRTRVSNIDSGDSNYYDLFADLDETEAGKEFIRESVGLFTWSMASYLVMASPEELAAKGITPINETASPEVQAQIKEDAEQAKKLLEELNADSSKTPENTNGRSAQGSSDQRESAPNPQKNKGRFFGILKKVKSIGSSLFSEAEVETTTAASSWFSSEPPKPRGYLTTITNALGFEGEDLTEVTANIGTNLGMKFLGLEGLFEAGTIFMDSYDDNGDLSKFKLATGMGGFFFQQGLKSVPIIGESLVYGSSVVGGTISRTLGSVMGLFTGRSAGEETGESPSDTNLFGRIGWRTADISSEDLHTQSAEVEGDTPFIGFGKCPREIVKLSDFDENEITGQAIKLYLSVVRTQCSLVESAQIFKFFVAQILQVEQDKTVGFIKDAPLLTKAKLSRYEAYDLSAAFEFSVFTKTLLSEWRNPTAPVGPDGSKITKTVHVFIQSALNAINEANKLSGSHFIRLVRNVVITLKTGFTELLQDYDRYKACSKCPPEIIQTSKNDLTAINALIQFIVVGLKPVDQVGQDAKEVFKQFYLNANNQQIIDEKVKMFF